MLAKTLLLAVAGFLAATLLLSFGAEAGVPGGLQAKFSQCNVAGSSLLAA